MPRRRKPPAPRIESLEQRVMLSQAGAPVIVQDEATSTVWGMPGSIAKAGLAQEILPLEAIGPVLRSHIAGPTS